MGDKYQREARTHSATDTYLPTSRRVPDAIVIASRAGLPVLFAYGRRVTGTGASRDEP